MNQPREVTTHRDCGEANQRLRIVAGEPGAGGAPTVYTIQRIKGDGKVAYEQSLLLKETGDYGLTNEALLAVILDRLSGFQKGPHPCEENDSAAWHIVRALDHLRARTERMDLEAGKEQSRRDCAARDATSRYLAATDEPAAVVRQGEGT